MAKKLVIFKSTINLDSLNFRFLGFFSFVVHLYISYIINLVQLDYSILLGHNLVSGLFCKLL